MASTPNDANPRYGDRAADAAREDEAPPSRSVGEHVFIWIAWALAAAFWGGSLTSTMGILQAAGQDSSTLSAPGAPGGSAFLVLVVAAFVAMGVALAYGSLRSASRSARVGEGATAALYDSIERQGGEDSPRQSPDVTRANSEIR
ncbi:hypothetical protein LJR225_001380 [Phenylobacterium sp. LjRoot225]|uniref:hypothetical protein n=1 Tax=Phenylobacterium sp. LjRoot225 TaxID=3342285 RepID=UPI003ECC3104